MNTNIALAFYKNSIAQPARLAISAAGTELSYGELAVRVQRIAAWLPKKSPGTLRVGVFGTRSVDACAAVLAVGLEGGAYVPIGLKWPDARIINVLELARLDAIICDQQCAARLTERIIAACPTKILIPSSKDMNVSGAIENMSSLSDQHLVVPAVVAENSLAYIEFTSGSTTFKGNHDRAVPLRMFLDAFAMPGVQLYSLQKGPPAAELKAFKNPPIIDLAPALDDFADAAAVVSELDLIIMTDSAVAHLGGALAKPVWVLLNYAPYWMWLDKRDNNPWYDSFKMFRQKSWGNWTEVFDACFKGLLQFDARA